MYRAARAGDPRAVVHSVVFIVVTFGAAFALRKHLRTRLNRGLVAAMLVIEALQLVSRAGAVGRVDSRATILSTDLVLNAASIVFAAMFLVRRLALVLVPSAAGSPSPARGARVRARNERHARGLRVGHLDG
jgi:hypothetical protein